MLFSWVRRGLRTGVLTTRYPQVREQMPEGFRGRLMLNASLCLVEQGCDACTQVCLPHALSLVFQEDGAVGSKPHSLMLDYARCIQCGMCVTTCPLQALAMTAEYELAASSREDLYMCATKRPDAEVEKE